MKSSRLILMMLSLVSLFLYACNSLALSNSNQQNSTPSNFTVTLDASNGSIHKNHEESVNLIPSAVLKFSHIINPDTVNSKNIILTDNNNNPVKLQYDINDARDIVTLAPDNALKSSTDYQLTITNNLKDVNGNNVTQTSYGFTTGSDSTPVITLTSPGDQAKDTPLSPVIRFQITAKMYNDSVNVHNITLTEFGDSSVLGIKDFLFDGAGNGYSKYYFTLDHKLSPYTKYELSFNDQITDANGNKLQPKKFYFTTGDSDAPTVNIMSPKINEVTSRAINLQFAFSQEVHNVNSDHVFLQNDVTKQNVKIGDIVNLKPKRLGEANFQYTLSPETDLDHNTKYNIIFTQGIVDNEEKELKPITFSFRTGEEDNPEVRIIEPDNGKTNTPTAPTIRLHFSKQVQNVTEKTVSLHENNASGKEMLISSIYSNNDMDYSFSPIEQLNSATNYVVIVDRGIISIDNHDPITGNNTFSFTTGNSIATTASLVSPNNNAHDMSLTPEIIVKFSRDVTNVDNSSLVLGSCTKPTCQLPEPLSGYKITQDPNNSTKYIITVAKGTQLTPHTQYKLSATSKITDTADTPITVNDFTLTTGEAVVPKVVFDSSGDQAITDKNIKFHFDVEGMNGVDQNTVVLKKDSLDGRAIEIKITDMGNSHYTIQPTNAADDFAFSTTYFIIFNAGITDSVGNKLPPKSFNITTGDEPNPEASFIKLVGSNRHACVLTIKNKIFCWGNNDWGQLGDGSRTSSDSPVPVKLPNVTFSDIYANGYNTCAVDAAHLKTYCWGVDFYGTLGNMIDTTNIAGVETSPGLAIKMPSAVNYFSKISIASSAPGDKSSGSCAIGDDHKVYCWGGNAGFSNSASILGPDYRSDHSTIPVLISSLPADINFYDIGRQYGNWENNTCALGSDINSNKYMYCWGGSSGKDVTSVKLPTGVKSFVEIASNSSGTCALGDNGRAYCWMGKKVKPYDNSCQSGNCKFVDSDIKLINMPAGVNTFSTISSGNNSGYFSPQACAIGDDSKVYCWRMGGSSNTPLLQAMPNNVKIGRLSSNCALNKNFNKVYCWNADLTFDGIDTPKLVEFK
jgi:hypothetical protein